MLPLRNAAPSSPSNISEPARNEIHSEVKMPQSCLSASCDRFLLQRTLQQGSDPNEGQIFALR